MESETTYQMFNLKNAEFAFDVDMSNLPCGLNGALYFIEMASDGIYQFHTLEILTLTTVSQVACLNTQPTQLEPNSVLVIVMPNALRT